MPETLEVDMERARMGGICMGAGAAATAALRMTIEHANSSFVILSEAKDLH
jgi:hypothetical protein